MARIDKKTGDKIYQTEDRQYVVKDQLLNVLFDSFRRFGDIIVSADKNDPYGDPRFDALTLFMTTFALDEEGSNELIHERQKMIDEMIDAENMTPKEQNKIMYGINIKTLSRCQSIFDNYYGIKKKQEIMRVASKDIEEEKNKYGGDDALGEMFAKGKEKAE